MRSLDIKNLDELPYGVKEAVNRLGVNLGYYGDQYKRILITSSIPEEGKSFISVNLWRTLAEMGKRVVLIDADMRRSELRSRHQIVVEDDQEAMGLSNYLANQVDLQQVLYSTNVPGGFIIPTFRTLSNSLILFQSERFGTLLDELAKEFDYVLLDTPPVASVADSLQIASHCDGALVVVRSASTPRKIISDTLKQLDSIKCPVIGTVLNQVETTKSSYYYRYRRYGYYSGKYAYEKK